MLPQQRQTIESILADAAAKLIADAGLETPPAPPSVSLDRPKVAAHGDAASNLAMQLAKPLKLNPRELAQKIADTAQADPRSAGLIDAIEIAGPGFINLRVAVGAKQAVVGDILAQGARYGFAPDNAPHAAQKVMVEFVSANPTGPLHLGHARQAALGDALARLLETQRWDVHREFYYNDAGVQIGNLAASVLARGEGKKPGDTDWPEAAYNGEYIADIAQDYLNRQTVSAKDGEPVTAVGDLGDLDAVRKFGVAYLRHEQDLDLQAFGVVFDCYYLESSLYTEGRVEEAVKRLVASGKTYEQDGALWLRTTDDGDDKDRVMRKTDGTYTYFVPDVAYHLTKWQRGFTKVINVQGTDHHGTIARVRAGLQGLNLGIPKGYPDYVLHKMVTVMRDGKEVKISKRAGSYVTLRDLIVWSGGGANADHAHAADTTFATPEVVLRGRDAVRFFLISRKADTEFVFDVDLALKQNDENPVYYVQYAHARISSILTTWAAEHGGDPALLSKLGAADFAALTTERALSLLQRLAEYPDMLARAADELAPHAVAFYLRDLAGEFHSFYAADRVLVDDAQLRTARIALLAATRQVLANGLATIGVSAPEKM
ncbi:MAG TPA: arginine--tRNA ligase [Pararobbsia sp.]|nr:arginine--tRNA ligase [Pararobbsia sp.]